MSLTEQRNKWQLQNINLPSYSWEYGIFCKKMVNDMKICWWGWFYNEYTF